MTSTNFLISPDPVPVHELLNNIPNCWVKKRNGARYLNAPVSFDIETSSFTDHGEKRACMYLWSFGINGNTVLGRTWQEFTELCSSLVDFLHLGEDRRICCYVHNLAYEFQWIQHYFEWDKIFALDTREVCYAVTNTGIEFRCSYLLSGYSLAKLGDQLTKYKVTKAVGDLDYSKIRHSGTPLTESEIDYSVRDVAVVMAYIQERIEADGNITRIPLTKTGYVRRACRRKCFAEGHRWRYMERISDLTLPPDLYRLAKLAFAGGLAHASPLHACGTLENVDSYDLTSAYPAAICMEKFPMSKPVRVECPTPETAESLMRRYCCVFAVTLYGVEASVSFEHVISVSKCWRAVNPIADNGRLVSADRISIACTEIDWQIFRRFYTWKSAHFGILYHFSREYLPSEFVDAVLELYEKKTTLKNVAGIEAEYMRSKEDVNSAYGAMVQDPCRPEITYDAGLWGTTAVDIESQLLNYNESKSRFLYYLWGVYVTAYCRLAVCSAIYNDGFDHVYTDTDSEKLLNGEKHAAFYEWYNRRIDKKIAAAAAHHGWSIDRFSPKTVKGVAKTLGYFEHECTYDKFKTLGAKRYMTLENGKLSITVAGLSKHDGAKYFEMKDDPFGEFHDAFSVPEEYSGRKTHLYIDHPTYGRVTDYLGMTAGYAEQSSIYMESAEYTATLSAEYRDYLREIRMKKKAAPE